MLKFRFFLIINLVLLLFVIASTKAQPSINSDNNTTFLNNSNVAIEDVFGEKIRVYETKNTSISDTDPAEWFLELKLPYNVKMGDSLRVVNTDNHILARFLGVSSACSQLEVIESSDEKDLSRYTTGIRPIGILRFKQDLVKGETVQFSVKAKINKIAYAGNNINILLHGNELPVVLSTLPGIAKSFTVIARPSIGNNGLRVLIQPLDEWKWHTTLKKPVSARLIVESKTVWQGEFSSNTILNINLPTLQAEVVRLDLQIKKTSQNGWETVAQSNPVWLRTEEIPMFGAMHWHDNLSGDGAQPIENGFRFGKDALNLDFIAPSDHTPLGIKWEKLTSAVDEFNNQDELVTLYGWEWSTNTGHNNFYFIKPDHLGNPNKLTAYVKQKNLGNTSDSFIDKLPFNNKDIVVIPHHTNATSYKKGAWEAYHWKEPAPGYLRLLEIFQTRGNQEREVYPDNKLWRAEFTNNGGSYQTGLDKGHHIGVVAGTDNHTSYPGRIGDSDTQGFGGSDKYFFTGVWAKKRTREGVLNALYDRNTWACWGTRAIVKFSINDVLQGGELYVSEKDNLTASIRISAEEPFKLLELVTKGDQAIPLEYDKALCDLTLKANLGKAGEIPYYYLRGILKNGALIYASPVFINLK